MESTYEECLALELSLRSLRFERPPALPISYKSSTILRSYRLDFVVEKKVIVELKTIEKILKLHELQKNRFSGFLVFSPVSPVSQDPFPQVRQCRLKNWTAFSCFSAAARVLNVPRFLRLPVFGFFFREYSRYSPDLSFRIMESSLVQLVYEPLSLANALHFQGNCIQ